MYVNHTTSGEGYHYSCVSVISRAMGHANCKVLHNFGESHFGCTILCTFDALQSSVYWSWEPRKSRARERQHFLILISMGKVTDLYATLAHVSVSCVLKFQPIMVMYIHVPCT